MPPTIVWIHGLGDSGSGWAHMKSELRLPGVEYVLPDAPDNPVSCNGGARMASWMDLEKIPVAIGDMNDVKGLKASAALIHRQIDAVIAKGIASQDVVIGGFSQGGAMALYAGYTYPQPLAGVVVFSGWAPLQATDEAAFMGEIRAGANANTPAFVAHGSQDEVVLPSCGERAEACLKEAGVTDVSFSTFAMGHATHPAQMVALKSWLKEKLRLE